MRPLAAWLALGALLGSAAAASAAPGGAIRVGAKSFTESYILAEVAAQIIEEVGEARAERRVGLGGTGLTYRALESGAIDLYPEYTGTLARVLLKDPSLATPDAIRERSRSAPRSASPTPMPSRSEPTPRTAWACGASAT
jgi:osmoprotectant transport system permease protein